MPPSTSTKERIIDEAMRLFGEQGYKGTSVIQIEKAAGLTPGAGGIYHHFSSKKSCWQQALSCTCPARWHSGTSGASWAISAIYGRNSQ